MVLIKWWKKKLIFIGMTYGQRFEESCKPKHLTLLGVIYDSISLNAFLLH